MNSTCPYLEEKPLLNYAASLKKFKRTVEAVRIKTNINMI